MKLWHVLVHQWCISSSSLSLVDGGKDSLLKHVESIVVKAILIRELAGPSLAESEMAFVIAREAERRDAVGRE